MSIAGGLLLMSVVALGGVIVWHRTHQPEPEATTYLDGYHFVGRKDAFGTPFLVTVWREPRRNEVVVTAYADPGHAYDEPLDVPSVVRRIWNNLRGKFDILVVDPNHNRHAVYDYGELVDRFGDQPAHSVSGNHGDGSATTWLQPGECEQFPGRIDCNVPPSVAADAETIDLLKDQCGLEGAPVTPLRSWRLLSASTSGDWTTEYVIEPLADFDGWSVTVTLALPSEADAEASHVPATILCPDASVENINLPSGGTAVSTSAGEPSVATELNDATSTLSSPATTSTPSGGSTAFASPSPSVTESDQTSEDRVGYGGVDIGMTEFELYSSEAFRSNQLRRQLFEASQDDWPCATLDPMEFDGTVWFDLDRNQVAAIEFGPSMSTSAGVRTGDSAAMVRLAYPDHTVGTNFEWLQPVAPGVQYAFNVDYTHTLRQIFLEAKDQRCYDH
ncbi:hypothetical protein F0U44_02795 [Nocardioides humilatus]|uniref:Uncharacterized protein n=1 Tax=Nocardioides humilatus TaxID=2607660 RepID=A0A5B1LNT2_9ACTN|nr:hypothetical protein [Nocardioides humilatus]KAA1421257.1 hypothetical protein F0U44_02795 [Nocardioides humilatus]